jgi:hypothetical protein
MEAPRPVRSVRLKFVDASTLSAIAGQGHLPGKTNYFIGNDPKEWHTNVPNYSAVEYRGLYSGVDAVFHGDNRRLEFDYNIAPGADPHRIALEVEGARRMRLNRAGDVLLGIDRNRDVVMGKPHIYQQSFEGRREIAGNYVLTARNRISFALGPYDHTRPLVIDPTLVYSTYLSAGTGESYTNAIAVDSSSPGCSPGCAVVTGMAPPYGGPFPTTPGSYNPGPPPADGSFAFISKLKPDGSGLVYSTFFGGVNPNGVGGDQIYAIAIDSTGAAYFGGTSLTEDNTPTTSGSFMPIRPLQGPVPFVAKLSPDGSTLVYSTYLDGTQPFFDDDAVSGIAVDSSFSAYVTGYTTTTNFPTTTGAFQTVYGASNGTAFVTKLSADGSSLVYSTYLGGNRGENVLSRGGGDAPGGAIALDSSNDAYVTGDTNSTNFPTKNPLIATCNNPCADAYVSELNPTGTALIYSTFLGGTTANKQSVGMSIAVDPSNCAPLSVGESCSVFVGGTTTFTNFPVTSNVVQSSPGVGFITKLAPNGTGLVYSSYFNGFVDSVAVGPDDSAVIFGFSTTSLPFESTADAFTLPACIGGGCNFDFISKLTADGSGLFFSTPIGANLECCGASGALDPSGTAYIAGSTGSPALPTTAGSFEPTLPSNYSGFAPYVAKVSPWSSTTLTISPTSLPSGEPEASYSPVPFSATGGTGAVTFAVTTGSLPPGMTLTPTGVLSGTPTRSGTFPLTVTAFDPNNDTGSQAYLLEIGCPTTITVSPTSLPPAADGMPYGPVTFTATGGVSPITFGITTFTLPSGFIFVGGVLSGEATTQTGSFPLIITATDSNGCMGTVSDTLTIGARGSLPATVMDNETITVTDTVPEDAETITVTDTVGVSTSANPLAQTINFPAPPPSVVYGAGSIPLSATASSGLPVSFTLASGSTGGMLSGTNNGFVTFIGAGLVRVLAAQTGNITYAAAPSVERDILVQPATLIVTTPPATRVYEAQDPLFPASITGFIAPDMQASIVTGSPAFTIASGDYGDAPVGTVLTLNTALGTLALSSANYAFSLIPSTLTVVCCESQGFVPASLPSPNLPIPVGATYYLTVSATSGLPVSYVVLSGPGTTATTALGPALTATGPGTITVQVSQAGSANISAATPINLTFIGH